MAGGVLNYALKTGAEEAGIARFRFTGVNGGNPTVYSEPTGQAYFSGITRSNEGIYVLAIRHTWKAIAGWVNVQGSADADGSVTPDVSGANSVTIDLRSGASADDLDAKVIDVFVWLERR